MSKGMLNTKEMQEIPEHLREKVQSLQNNADLAEKWGQAFDMGNLLLKEATMKGIRWFTSKPLVAKIGLSIFAGAVYLASRKK